jgi:hypothetical protein
MRVGRIDSATKLIVRHYGSVAGKASLYDDDGESFGYEKGEFAWFDLTSTAGVNGEMTKREGSWKGNYKQVEWRHVG